MKMHKPFLVVLAGIALALGGLYGTAEAITARTANDKGAGYQHYECSAQRARCLQPNLERNRCHGPYGGTTQWVCTGRILIDYSGAPDECYVVSRWGPWGNLNFGRRYCSSVPPVQN